MSGDFLSLGVLVVSGFRPLRSLWRQGAAQASVPVEFCEAEPAGAAAAMASADILILDAGMTAGECAPVIASARARDPAPLVVLSGPGAIAGAADFLLPKPMSVDEARMMLDRCIRMRLPTRVLVVDDSGTMRAIVRKILSCSRYRLNVSEIGDGRAALASLGEGAADVVMLDYNMPGLNGLETLAEIKRVAPNTAVVMMTTNVDEGLASRARMAGAIGFLKKPFYPADIDAVLDGHYEKAAR